jgi:hypothetical protein
MPDNTPLRHNGLEDINLTLTASILALVAFDEKRSYCLLCLHFSETVKQCEGKIAPVLQPASQYKSIREWI